ncbi:MAG: hypothetical protein WEB67_03385 [Acidimicrobiia bacterium]
MERFKTLKVFSLAIAVSLVMTACDNGEVEPELTTTSSLVGQTTAPDPDTTTTVDGDEMTTTSLVGQTVDSYEVVLRESTDEGETLYIVVPPGDYTAIDLENFIGDLIEGDDDLESVEVFDDEAALDSFRKDESEQTASDLSAIDAHHLVSLVDSHTIRFQGPFADEGEYAIGS